MVSLAVACWSSRKSESIDGLVIASIFFEKATVTEKDGILEATGENVNVHGDTLTVWVVKKTNLYTKKKFSSLLGMDPVEVKLI